jgi:chromosome segregation ATPase
MSSEWTLAVSAGGLVIALIGVILTGVKALGAAKDHATAGINAARDAAGSALGALREVHDRDIAELRRDAASAHGNLARDVDQLERSTARRDELANLENRVSEQLKTVSGQIEDMRRQLALLPVVQEQMTANGKMLERIAARLDRGAA